MVETLWSSRLPRTPSERTARRRTVHRGVEPSADVMVLSGYFPEEPVPLCEGLSTAKIANGRKRIQTRVYEMQRAMNDHGGAGSSRFGPSTFASSVRLSASPHHQFSKTDENPRFGATRLMRLPEIMIAGSQIAGGFGVNAPDWTAITIAKRASEAPAHREVLPSLECPITATRFASTPLSVSR